MNKPLLVVLAGRPGSGKTTLAHILSQEIKCPLLSRDELKEGYVNTLNMRHSQLYLDAGWHIYDTFFETTDLLISKGVSIIIEAAFQHKLWEPKLSGLLKRAHIKVVICNTTSDVAKRRFTQRLQCNPEREKFHGDSLILLKEQDPLLTAAYMPLNMDVPTLEVDTTENYNPNIKTIISFIGL